MSGPVDAPTRPAARDRFSIARDLREIGTLLRLKGDRSFRAMAYERGAQALESIGDSFESLVASRSLTSIPGIGPSLTAVILELHREGRSRTLERLRCELPPGAAELASVPSLTLRRMRLLHDELGVDSVAALEAACRDERVRTVRGFGPATEKRLLESLIRQRDRRGTLLLPRALELGDELLAHARDDARVVRAEVAGPLRRRCETIDAIALVASSTDPEATVERFLRAPALVEPAASGRVVTGRLLGGCGVTVEVTGDEGYVAALHRWTGSRAHREKLARTAMERGLRLEAEGLVSGGALVPLHDEHDLYRGLGIAYVPPEMREDAGEVEAAAAGELPSDLVTVEDLRGSVHCHTDHSDGRDSIEWMARAAQARGMGYITITDHSPSAFYAGGLDLERLQRQWEEIERVQEKVAIRILRGTESDILADGGLDYPDSVLEKLDVVIASIHNRHAMSAGAMTRRIVSAMRRPIFKIWGHGLGRLLGRRPPIACDVEAILDAAAGSRTAIEINGDPHRLDLEPAWIRAARRRGLSFVVSSDAHATGELGNATYGVAMARRGWVRRGEVLNTLDVEQFRQAVRPGA